VRHILRVSIVFSLIVGCLCQLQAQLDPLIGVWALDLSKSIYEPGPPPLRLSTTYRKTTEGYAFVSEGLDAQGRPFKVDGAVIFDGQYHPTAGSPNWDEVAFRPIDAFTSEVTRRKAGVVVQTARRVLSPDGTVLTITTNGVDATGRRTKEVAVYEKQR